MPLELSARNIVKRYGGVVALSDGNLKIASGEVVALVGANGSGKSTLSKIITGVVAPNGGQLHLDGEEVHFATPQIAKRYGNVAVYQELSLIPDMTVSENIWLGHEPLAGRLRLRRKVMVERTQSLLDLFAGTLSDQVTPNSIVKELAPDERQIVEILKAMSNDPRLIILDEATASLDRDQVDRLFELVEEWKKSGKAVVIITHRMDEIFRVADRATVLRNGQWVGDVDIANTTEDVVVQMMIEGATSPEDIRIPSVSDDAPIRLEVSDLHSGQLNGVSLTLRDGELLGLGGLQGQGQADLLLALFGAIPHKGKIMLGGQPVHFRHPSDAMHHSTAFVPGDRNSEGLLMERSILENFQLASWERYGLVHDVTAARDHAEAVGEDLSLVYAGLDEPVSSLSGGNAQKVVIGRWLLRQPKLLLLNDPTKGVDVGAKGEFYVLLKTLTQQGTAILFYSSDDDELLGLCNRVLVMQDGHIRAELAGDDLNRSNLVAASMGTKNGIH